MRKNTRGAAYITVLAIFITVTALLLTVLTITVISRDTTTAHARYNNMYSLATAGKEAARLLVESTLHAALPLQDYESHENFTSRMWLNLHMPDWYIRYTIHGRETFFHARTTILPAGALRFRVITTSPPTGIPQIQTRAYISITLDGYKVELVQLLRLAN
jgi:heme/copper-type cytochrome/quinol oxidase subunit 2